MAPPMRKRTIVHQDMGTKGRSDDMIYRYGSPWSYIRPSEPKTCDTPTDANGNDEKEPLRQPVQVAWVSKSPQTLSTIYRCFKDQKDMVVTVGQENWKTEVPQLCELLGLRCQATKDEVKAFLDQTQAFQLDSSIMTKYGFDSSRNVQYDVQELDDGKYQLKISVPAKYDEKLANRDSAEFCEMELYAKQELARALGIPEKFLFPEVTEVDFKPGSIKLCIVLTVGALILCCIAWGVMQTAEWNCHKFEILMLAGGLVSGAMIGSFGGPIGAGIGFVVGGVTLLGFAKLIKGKPFDACAQAVMRFYDGCIQVVIKFASKVLSTHPHYFRPLE